MNFFPFRSKCFLLDSGAAATLLWWRASKVNLSKDSRKIHNFMNGNSGDCSVSAVTGFMLEQGNRKPFLVVDENILSKIIKLLLFLFLFLSVDMLCGPVVDAFPSV